MDAAHTVLFGVPMLAARATSTEGLKFKITRRQGKQQLFGHHRT
jgi:hypothetical protein